MNTQIRFSQILSRCLLACSVLVLLSTATVYAKTASASKNNTNVKTSKATKAKATNAKATKETNKTKEDTDTVSVLKDGANVRTGPSTDDQIAMELFQGYPLKVVEKKGEWLKVSDFENDSGWINKTLVEPGKTVIVNSQKAINMRSEPSATGAIVANIERGVVLTKISLKGDWVKVRHTKGTEGWINKTLLWP